MGIKDLFRLYKKNEVKMEEFRGQRIGIDIQCFLYRFSRGNGNIAFDIIMNNDYSSYPFFSYAFNIGI